MAEAGIEKRPITVEQEHIVLTLTLEEAAALHDVTQHIGGDPGTTRRRHLDAIQTVLRSHDVSKHLELFQGDIIQGGGVRFTDRA